MKITAIKQQIKRSDRYSIYIDGEYVCSFGETELLNAHLRIGQDLSAAELKVLKANALSDKAYDRSLNLISLRARSRWELEDYLKRKNYEAEVIEATIERLQRHGYVDDVDFAKRWIENRRLLKPTSKRRLQQELRQKRVADNIVEDALGGDATDELLMLRELVERKRKQTKYQDDLKLMQYLSRQGFTYDMIKEALQSES